MAITQQLTYHNKLVKRYGISKMSSCSGCVESYQLTRVGYLLDQDYSEERRIRPESVWDSFTSRAPIKRALCRYAREWSPQVPCTGCIRKNYAYTTKTQAFRVEAGWENPNLIPQTDWALKARQAIEERQQNVAESLYEWRQTSKMVVAAAKILRSGWRIYKGRLPRRRQKFSPCDVASAELVGSFGINPLIAETQEAYERLVERVAGGLVSAFRVGAEATRTTTVKSTLFEGDYSWKRKQRASFLVQYHEIVPSFTMGAPWELAYELTPFSWLIDGFIDIGGYLGALDSMSGVARVKGTLTTRDYLVATGWGRKYSTSILEAPEKYIEIRYMREVLNDIPLPPIPKFRPGRSWHKLMHATSALVAMNHRCSGRKNPLIV